MRVRLALAVVAALATAGCGLTGGSKAEAGTVSIAIAEPAHLLPSNTGDRDGAQVLAALFTPLVRYDEGHRPVPAAAESVTSTDNRTWRITLAEGYTFHDGEAVTADSYLNAWNFAAYGPNRQRNAYLFDRIQGFADMQGAEPAAQTFYGLRKVDARRFDVRLATPFADFPAMLGHPAFLPLPASAFAAPGRLRPGFEDAVVGQGPFRMTGRWERGEQIRVERHAASPVPAAAAKIQFRVYDDSADAYDDLLDGDLDVDAALPAGELAEAARRLGDRYAVAPAGTVNMLAFPGSQAGFTDVRVRRAVSLAIDRDALVAAHFPGADRPARSFVPPIVPGHRPDTCREWCRFDPAAARALYAEGRGPARLTIAYNADGGHADWVQAVCGQLAANLGVTCAGAPEPTFDALLDKVRQRRDVGLFRMSWSMDYPSMESYLTPLFTAAGSSNYGGYQSPDVDTLVRRAAQAPTAAAAAGVYQQVEDVLAGDMPVVPLRWSQRAVGHSPRVSGVRLNAYEVVDVTALQPA